MTELWNRWDIQPPPICSVKMIVYPKEMSNQKQLLFDILNTLKSMNSLDGESAILSRYLFKYRRIFRHDKGMQLLVKINQCLRRYLKLNLFSVINSYKKCFPPKFKEGRTHAYLPTKQNLKWVLLRLQAFTQIFVRLIDLCKASGAFYYGKLLLGWSINLTFFIFTLLARILTWSKFMVTKGIEWYNSLHRYLAFFEETAEFLPGYKFPNELKKWLGDVDLTPPKKKSSIDQIFELIDLVKDEDDDDDDDEVKISNENLVKNLFQSKVIEIDSDIEEIEVKLAGESKEAEKRPQTSGASTLEDLGVPVGDDDDDDDIQVLQPPTKRFKKDFKKKKNRFKGQFRNGRQ